MPAFAGMTQWACQSVNMKDRWYESLTDRRRPGNRWRRQSEGSGPPPRAATYENRNTAAAIAQVQRLSGPHIAVAVIDSLSMIRLLCS